MNEIPSDYDYDDDDSLNNTKTADQASQEDDLKIINETIQNLSRNLRKGDWTYLGRHPEIRAIIRVIITEASKHQHQKNIFRFAADLFQPKNLKKLTKLINKQLKWVNTQVSSGAWSPADGPILFPETSSSSFESKKPTCEKASSECEDLFLKQNMCPEYFKPSC